MPRELPAHSTIATVVFALVPGFVMLLVPYGLSVLDPLGRTTVLSAYYLVEVILLLTIMGWVARREGISLRRLIGYTRPLAPAAFVVLAMIGALWAIGVRDFLQVDAFRAWAMTVQGIMPAGWPSIYARLPATDTLFEGGTAVTALALVVGTVSVTLASIMQSLYFRGFLLSRIDHLGWTAPALITVLFVVFHMGSPPFWHLFLLLTLPWAFIAYGTKNVWVVVVSHAVMNSYSGIFALFAQAVGGS